MKKEITKVFTDEKKAHSFPQEVYTPEPGETPRFRVEKVLVRHAKDTGLARTRVRIEFSSAGEARRFDAIASSDDGFSKSLHSQLGGELKHIVIVDAPPSQGIHETVLKLLWEAKPLNPEQFGGLVRRALGRD